MNNIILAMIGAALVIIGLVWKNKPGMVIVISLFELLAAIALTGLVVFWLNFVL
jgi:hypothetical protein